MTISASQTDSAVLTFPVQRNVQILLDQAMYEVMSARFAGTPHQDFGKCAAYAIVGAQVLHLLTGARCEAVCGGQIMDCGNEQYLVISPKRAEIRNARYLSDLSNYHCWIEVTPPGIHLHETLIIDFTARYDADSAKFLGQSYAPAERLNFLWEHDRYFNKQIPQAVQHHPHLRNKESGWLWREARCEKLLNRYAQQNRAQFAQMCADTLQIFADKVESLMQETVAA